MHEAFDNQQLMSILFDWVMEQVEFILHTPLDNAFQLLGSTYNAKTGYIINIWIQILTIIG